MKRAVVECEGLHVEIRVYTNDDGPDFVELSGLDCSLEGSAPGQYVPTPLAESDRIGPDVDFIGAGDEVIVLGPHPWRGVLRDVDGPVDTPDEIATVMRHASVPSLERVRFARVAHPDSGAARFMQMTEEQR